MESEHGLGLDASALMKIHQAGIKRVEEVLAVTLVEWISEVFYRAFPACRATSRGTPCATARVFQVALFFLWRSGFIP